MKDYIYIIKLSYILSLYLISQSRERLFRLFRRFRPIVTDRDIFILVLSASIVRSESCSPSAWIITVWY